MKKFYRGLIIIISLLFFWQIIVIIFQLPPYILPAPFHVFKTLYLHRDLILTESIPTIIETVIGLFLGTLLGCIAALVMISFRPLSLWVLPILIISQAIPTFALAPLLVIWFGFGMASKIMTTIIMLFFPITNAFYDGLRRTEPGWLDLAQTWQAPKWRIIWYIRIPAALPHLASGLKIATAVAPIGAIVGEWVGASKGLGFLMLNANARMQIDLMFAALLVLVIFSLILYFVVDKFLRYFIFWQLEL